MRISGTVKFGWHESFSMTQMETVRHKRVTLNVRQKKLNCPSVHIGYFQSVSANMGQFIRPTRQSISSPSRVTFDGLASIQNYYSLIIECGKNYGKKA